MQTTVINEPVFRRWDYLVFSVLTLVNLVVVGAFLYYWFSPGRWQADSIVAWLFTFQLLYWLAVHQFRWCLLPCMEKPKPMSARPGWKVGVATTFVPGLESIEMLEKTVAALVAMKYPHDTWVLDEGDDNKVKTLCRRLGAHHFTRRHLTQYQTADGQYEARTKHGNYNAWLSEIGYARYDIITGFDPDHVPSPEFLNQVLGFFNDPRIAYVQAPQVYYNQDASFVARGAAEETYSYYSSTQMASYHMGFPIITGCHHSHRVTALEQVGGFAAHDADDLLITLLYRAAGWRGVYQPVILAKGLTPVDWTGYLNQQLRWVQSVLDVKFRAFPRLAGHLPFRTRLMSALHGLFYIQEGVAGLLVVGLLAFMLVSGRVPKFLTLETLASLMGMFLILQLTDLYHQRFFLDPRREWGFHWRAAVLRAAKWPYTLLGIIGALSGHKRPYSLTVKIKTESKRSMLLVPHSMVVAVLAVAWLIGAALGRQHHVMLIAPVVLMMVLSLGLMWTDTRNFPAPFDLKLWRKSFTMHPKAGQLHVRVEPG
jgi:cellulose synthase (UDP-forming)